MTDVKPSKTAKKREQAELQSIGEALIELAASELARLDLDENLLEAVQLAQRIRSNGALRRQKQFIGRLMRNLDAEPIRKALDARAASAAGSKKLFASAERWRDRIVKEGLGAANAFCEATGDRSDTLERLCADLDGAYSDAAEKTAKRSIFRHVHAVLADTHQDDKISR